jgi:hypothetical protein
MAIACGDLPDIFGQLGAKPLFQIIEYGLGFRLAQRTAG